MSNTISDFSNVNARYIQRLLGEAENSKYPKDLQYLKLIPAIAEAEIYDRAGVHLSPEVHKGINAGKNVLAEHGIIDAESANNHLYLLEQSIDEWRILKENLGAEYSQKLAELQEQFLKNSRGNKVE